jgi:hypothetical protein
MIGNYLNNKAAAASKTAVEVNNSYCNDETTNQVKEIETFAKKKKFEKLAQSLNGLCGDNGYSEINIYKGNYQIHLFFKSEKDRHEILKTLSKIFNKFKITDNFQAWQFETTQHHFCLKLSSNQTAALLDSDPNYDATFEAAQGVLCEIKKAKEDRISQMPTDILNHIVALSNIQGAGRCASVSKKFQEVTGDEILWRNIASKQNIPLEGNNVPPKEQMKLHMYWQTVISLKPCIDSQTILPNNSVAKLQSMGALCLTPSRSTGTYYEGIVVLKEKTAQGERWFLHLRPGAAYSKFTEQDFENLMPGAIENLKNNKIIPNYLSPHTGRHSGDTLKNFENWQQKQSLKGFEPPKAT